LVTAGASAMWSECAWVTRTQIDPAELGQILPSRRGLRVLQDERVDQDVLATGRGDPEAGLTQPKQMDFAVLGVGHTGGTQHRRHRYPEQDYTAHHLILSVAWIA